MAQLKASLCASTKPVQNLVNSRVTPFRSISGARTNVWSGNVHGQAWNSRAPGQARAAETSTVQLTSGAEPSSETSTEKSVFNWTSHWWPVHDVASIDPKIPMHLDILGLSVVVWADSKGQWHCLEDRCSHRLAPLSEGRVEGDALMCSYHGWTFDGAGSCTNIPQVLDPEAQATAVSSKRCGIKSYPVQVKNGLLWVWPESDALAALKAAATDVTHIEMADYTPWFARDVPIRYDTLLENVVDPSHVPFAHHGVQGNRYKPRPGWETMKYQKPTLEGAALETDPTPIGALGIQFKAPGYVTYSMGGALLGPQAIVVPTKPGWSKIIVNFGLRFSKLPLQLRMIMKLVTLKSKIPFVDHFERNAVIDGDTYMLHIAERLLPVEKGIGKEAIKAYYMPSGADAAVVMIRNWLQEFGGQVPTCEPGAVMPPTMDKAQVLDRWNQHTKNCVHCRTAAENLDKLRSVSLWVGLAAAVATVAQAVSASALVHLQAAALPAAATALPAFVPAGLAAWWQACQAAGLSTPLAAAAAVAVACAMFHNWLTHSIRPRFYYQEYVHALRD